MSGLALLELRDHDWPALQTIRGPATDVPVTLTSVFTSESPGDLKELYWRLENHVVVQSQLFDSALAVVPVLLAALVDSLHRHARIFALELLFHIVGGESHELEVGRGQPDLGARCREEARKGLWLLYREALLGHTEAAMEILEIIDTPQRLACYLEAATVDVSSTDSSA